LTRVNADRPFTFSLKRKGTLHMQNQTGREGIDAGDLPVGVKVAFLASPQTHPGAREVELRETNMAWVFLAGDRVLKMKKPVRRPFLDYSTLEARRRVCEDEVRLNRRLAPDVYLGVARLTCDQDGSLAVDGKGRTVDWLVVMRRLPEARMLDRMILAGTVDQTMILAVADRLAAFYRDLASAEVEPAAYLELLKSELDIGRNVFSHADFNALSTRGLEVVGRLERLLEDVADLLAGRIADGRIVEGHGDLRPEHVCLTDPPVIIDCLEFSEDLRMVDPFYELAYLGMECAVLGADWVGPVIVARCAAALDDMPAKDLLEFYTGYRAVLRARQALAHLLDPHPRTPEKWQPLAALYLDQAESALLRLRLPEDRPASRRRAGAGRPRQKGAPR
jgi:aminoglycoside phosphotransferase family enzyme